MAIDSNEVERVARTLCAAKGINPDSLVTTVIPHVVAYNPVRTAQVPYKVAAWTEYIPEALRAISATQPRN